ncbi:hypothetical protein [Vibrio variabilis]|uniref:hypothetical protein n=1 Tax=Vibrio variabilis TaxID=990271 RepID=UPI000DD5EF24|nr:hypothetical protein [Vibrio variabilis]
MGGILVLRDHTHADYCVSGDIPDKSELESLLEKDFKVKSILTIRNPIDSYTSLIKNGWVHFAPQTFDEYCRRILLLVKNFNDDQIFSYEDFIKRPSIEMQALCKSLAIPFEESFDDMFGIFRVTGDSGRSSDIIGDRSRVIDDNKVLEYKTSDNYKLLIDEFKNKLDWLD